MATQRPIFLLGCPRSGTTMLQVMLHAHPRIAIPPETRFVLSVYTGRRQLGDLRSRDNRHRLARHVVGGEALGGRDSDLGLAYNEANNLFRDLRLGADEVTAAIVAGPPTVGAALGTVFRAYAQRFGKPRWGDKRPAYYRYLPFLLRMFPDAQFVQIVRDGRACVASLKRMPWWRRDVYTAVAEWALAFDNFRSYARRLPADSFHQVRYEDLVADPQGELARLCAFLGEDYQPAMSQPRDVAGVAVPARKRKSWHQNTHRDVSANEVAKWRTELTGWELALCETVLGDRLRSYGYQLEGAGRADVRHLARYAARKARLDLHTRRILAYDRVRTLAEPGPVADLPHGSTGEELVDLGSPRR